MSQTPPESGSGKDKPSSLPPAYREAARRVLEQEARKAADAARSLMSPSERAERVRNLEFVELSIDREHPEESPDFIRYAKLYERNLLSDDALARLVAGDDELYIYEMEKGKMMNRFDPSSLERSEYQRIFDHYGSKFVSVKDQMIVDMLGHNEDGGVYKVFGLRDPSAPDEYAATLSMRLPPPEAALGSGYINAMGKMFTRAWYKPGRNESIFATQFRTMAEIDTINADANVPGAGTRLLYEALLLLQDHDRLPQSFVYYRCGGISMEDGRYYGGTNMASANFFNKLAFSEMADRSDEFDWMVRNLSPHGSLFRAHTHWVFGHKPTQELLPKLVRRMEKKQLLTGPSRLRLAE